MPILKKINIDIPSWLTIIITVTPLLIGTGIVYGQMRNELDTLQNNFEKEQETTTVKLETMAEVMMEQKIQLTKIDTMLELLLRNERIAIPEIPDFE